MKIAQFFDVVVALEDTGKQKPNALPFQVAARKLGLDPFQVLFVGDRPSRDIAGAHKLGMRTALAKYGESTTLMGKKRVSERQESSDFELQDFADILPLLRRVNKPL